MRHIRKDYRIKECFKKFAVEKSVKLDTKPLEQEDEPKNQAKMRERLPQEEIKTKRCGRSSGKGNENEGMITAEKRKNKNMR